MPEDASAIEKYLASGAVKGIGEALAKRIVAMFGDDTFAVMTDQPELLANVKGISARKAQEISGQMSSQRDIREATVFLREYGIGAKLAVKIYAEYGQSMYMLIRENPYRLIDDIEGIGFLTADDIAAKLGINTDSKFRIRGAISYVLTLASNDGSTYLPKAELVNKTASLLSLPAELIEIEADNMAVERKIVIKSAGEEKRFYLTSLYFRELESARRLTDISAVIDNDEDEIEERIKVLLKTSKISLEEEQINAIRYAAKYGLVIITGGPGTGRPAGNARPGGADVRRGLQRTGIGP